MKFVISFSLWLALTLAVRSDVPQIPIYPINNSFTAFVDANGYVNPIINLGNIDFGKTLSLPLVLNFSSAIRSPSPAFGQGWECPLFEAKVVDVQQDQKKVELLGGKTIYLIYNQRTGVWKHFYSNHWTGQVKDEDFELSYDNAWKFLFHDGLISSMTTPGGRMILWNRSGGKLMSMNESGKPPAMQIVYDNLGFTKQILLDPDALGGAKNTYNFSSNLIYAGIDKIDCFNGRQIKFERSHDKSLNPIFNLTDTKSLGGVITWDKNTGKILSDGNYAYTITEVLPDNTYPRMFRKSNLTGKTDSFYYDPRHGTTDVTLADGTIRHMEMVVAPGPNYKEIRLIQETVGGNTRDILRRAFDDQNHLILEAIGLPDGKEQIKQFSFDAAGRAASYILNGKEIWKNVYDPVSGLLKERDLSDIGVKIAFDQQPDGHIKELVEKADGSVTSSTTMDSKSWQAAVSNFEKTY
jgi:hypothetical protein